MRRILSLVQTIMNGITGAMWLAGYVSVILGIMIFAVCWEAISADSAEDAEHSLNERDQRREPPARNPAAVVRKLAELPRTHQNSF